VHMRKYLFVSGPNNGACLFPGHQAFLFEFLEQFLGNPDVNFPQRGNATAHTVHRPGRKSVLCQFLTKWYTFHAPSLFMPTARRRCDCMIMLRRHLHSIQEPLYK
jgi:hypothetical protein